MPPPRRKLDAPRSLSDITDRPTQSGFQGWDERRSSTIEGAGSAHVVGWIDLAVAVTNSDVDIRPLVHSAVQGFLDRGQIPAEVWLNDRGLISRYVLEYRPDEDSPAVVIDSRVSDFGHDAVLQLPPTARVEDVTTTFSSAGKSWR